MKKRIHLKKRKSIRKNNIFFITIVIVIISTFILLNLINKKINPIIVETSEIEINKLSTIVINRAISQVLEDKINTDEIFSTVISKEGQIQTIDFNPVIVNQVLNLATTVVQDNLRLLENGELDRIGIYDINLSENRIDKLKNGIVTEIPIGVVFKNSILSNIGPKIPIKMHYVGDVNSNITTKITPYGINNAMVEVGVHLEMTAQIILPLTTKKMIIECNIPLAIKIIQGNVPSYYGSGLVKDSSIYSIPME